MLSVDIHRRLAALYKEIYALAAAAERRAPTSEIELRVAAARATAAGLEQMVGAEFGSLRRHLGWLLRRHREGRPDEADGDVADLRERDLPDVIDTVATWSAGLLDVGLAAAVAGSWRSGEYDAAVRAAFVHLEQRMRAVGAVPPNESVVGRRLVNRVLPGNGPSEMWTADGFMGHLNDGEQSGARELLNGSLSLFRNATAHRETGYALEEAEDILHLVSLCLRLLAKVQSTPP